MQPSNNGRWMMRLHHKLKLTNQYVAKRLNFNQIYSFSQFFNLVIAVIMRTDVLDSDWLLQMSQNAQYPSKEDVFNCKAEWVCVVSLNMRFVNTSFLQNIVPVFSFQANNATRPGNTGLRNRPDKRVDHTRPLSLGLLSRTHDERDARKSGFVE